MSYISIAVCGLAAVALIALARPVVVVLGAVSDGTRLADGAVSYETRPGLKLIGSMAENISYVHSMDINNVIVWFDAKREAEPIRK